MKEDMNNVVTVSHNLEANIRISRHQAFLIALNKFGPDEARQWLNQRMAALDAGKSARAQLDADNG